MKVEEGKRVGKNPWCCSGDIERRAYARLNTRWPQIDYPQESFWESYDRWLKEGVITQEEYDKAKEGEHRDKYLNKLFKIKDALDFILKNVPLTVISSEEISLKYIEVDREIVALLLKK